MITPFDTLKQIRTQYGTPMHEEERAQLLNRTAYIHRADGWGLLRKDGGAHVTLPDGTPIAQDILFQRNTGIVYDVLQDAEGAGDPTWQELGPMDLSRFVAPLAPGAEPPQPEPTPIPTPTPVACKLNPDELVAINQQLHNVLGELAQVKEGMTILAREINAINARLGGGLEGSANIRMLGNAPINLNFKK